MSGQARQNDEQAAGQRSSNTPYRTKLCRNYPLGTCRYGDHCSYLHVLPVPSPTTSRAPSYPSLSLPLATSAPTSTTTSHMRPASSRLPNDARTPPSSHRDTRLRAPRPDGPRRERLGHTPTAPAAAATHVAEVEKWRLAVSAPCLPPAPPATPVLPGVSGDPALGDSVVAPAAGLGMVGSGELGKPRWAEWQGVGVGGVPQRGGPARYPLVMKPVRHRNQFFKTKPCRFYREPGGCIKGDRCNFIHEFPGEGRRPSVLVVPAPEVASEGEGESGAESSVQEEAPSTAATSEHTPSIVSPTDQKKTNFYPVTWRVLGGGVMMSGKREVCENFMAGHCAEGVDCRYAHPETSACEEDYMAYGPPSVYGPISPMLSPVVFAYPMVYPTLSSPQAFTPPALPGGHTPSASLDSSTHASQTPQNGPAPSSRATAHGQMQPSGLPSLPAPYGYSPHRVVDGTTLAQAFPDGGALLAARAVVRPVSTPPTPLQGADAGVARLFAAEMP